MGMPHSPDGELLTQTAARELLERAGQIDSDSTSVDTLRAAAREAGISDAAFEAALVEMRRKMAIPAEPVLPRWRKRLVLTTVAVAMLLAAAAFVIIPRAVGSARSGMLEHEILVQCLPMRQAQDIAQTLLVSPGNEVRMSQGSRVLRVRATAAQVNGLQSAYESAAKAQAICDNTPAGR
jgi:hypothetical protein